MIFYRRWQPVKALSFDLDDTLYFNQPIIERTELRLVDFLNQRFDLHTDMLFWRQAKAEAIASTPLLLQDFTLMRRHILRHGLQKQGITEPQLSTATEQAFTEFYRLRSDFEVDNAIHQLLQRLASRYPLVAISNGNVNLDAIGLGDYFVARFHGGIHNTLKPHRTMFDLTCAELNLAAGQILHVGDDLVNDVMGAKRAGFRTAWYADDRHMDMRLEPVSLLPDVQLHKLAQLEELLC